MAVTMFASVSGAPGVTTTSVAFAAHRSGSLLVEADTAKTSDILAGAMRASQPHTMGLTKLLIASNQYRLGADELLGQRVPLANGSWLVPGLDGLEAARNSPKLWDELAQLLVEVDDAGMPVVVDAGRWSVDDARQSLLGSVDTLVLLLHARLPEIVAARAHVPILRRELEAAGRLDAVQLAVVDTDDEHYSPAEVANAVGAPVIATLANDPKGAQVHSLGRASRQKRAGAFDQSVAALAQALADLSMRRQRDLQEQMARQDV